jgi:hypothetical protein
VQVAALTQLFLGDPDSGPGFSEVEGEALLWTHGDDSLRLKTKGLQTTGCGFIVRAVPSATFLSVSRRGSKNLYAGRVERRQPMCYTHANNGKASDLAFASVAGLTAAKEES